MEGKSVIQSPEIVQELFLSWIAEEVSFEQVPKLHAVVNEVCANIEDIFHEKGFFVKSFFEITDIGVLDSLLDAIDDMADDLGLV